MTGKKRKKNLPELMLNAGGTFLGPLRTKEGRKGKQIGAL